MITIADKKKSLNQSVWEYLNNKYYMISLAVATVAAFLFFVTHYSVSIDDLARDRYVLDGYILAQGRFTGAVLTVLLGFLDVNTGVLDFFGILFLAMAAIVFCAAFDCIYKTESKLPQGFFSCLLITFPLHAEAFVYSGCALAIGLGLLLSAVALWIILQQAEENSFSDKTVKNILVAALLLTVPASWYESVLFVYYSAVFALLTLKVVSQKERGEFSFKNLIVYGLHFAVPLIFAVVGEYLFQSIFLEIWDTDIKSYALNSSNLASAFSFNGLINLIGTCYKRWFIPVFYYFPVTVFAGAVITGGTVSLVLACKKRDIKYLLVFIGLLSGTAINTVLLMQGAPYRTSQAVSFFVAFTAFFVLLLLSRTNGRFSGIFRKAVAVFLAVLCINQITEINYWFNIEELRYQNEKLTVEQVAYKLNSEFDIQKPVVFVGEYCVGGDVEKGIRLQQDSFGYKAITGTKQIVFSVCEKLEKIPGAGKKVAGAAMKLLEKDEGNTEYSIPQTIGKSYISWGVSAFKEVNTELLKFFSYLGYDYIQGTQEMYEDALVKAENKPAWPKNGSISDEGEYILVNFGVETAKTE